MAGTQRKHRGPRSSIDWSQVDWAIPNPQLSQQLGVSCETVRSHRCLAGQWRPYRPQARPEVLARQQRLEAALIRRPLARVEEITSEVGVGVETVRKMRRQLGLPRLQPAPRTQPRSDPLLDRLNWELPSSDLARIWGLRGSVVPNNRHRRRMQPARWSRRQGRTPRDPEYFQALEREEQKAREYMSQRRAQN